MTRLPVLVEHGPIVWQGLAVVAAAVAIWVVRRARTRRERRRAVRQLAACAAETTAPVDGRATVRGTLRGGRAASVSLLHLRGPRPYYDERAPGLWLDCDGQRVALDGAIRVARGSRVVTTRDRRSTVPDDELAVRSSPILHRLPALAVSVRDGDDVFVTARLASRPGAEVRGYREATTVWTATPDAGERSGAIEVVAAAPVIRAIPLGWTRSAALGAAAAALAIAALWSAGAAALWWARTADPAAGHPVPDQLGELEPLALAAATPGHRDAALAALEVRFRARFQPTSEAFARWRAVARLRGGCGGELEARIAQGEIDDLAELARGCDDDRAAADAYQLLGLFRAAAERDAQLPARDQHIESLIAIGAWQRAGWWAGSQRDRAPLRSPSAFACAEQWFRWLAGSVPAGEAERRFPRGDSICTVIGALLTVARPDIGPASDLESIGVRAVRSGDGRELAEHLARRVLHDTAAIEAAIEAAFAVWPRLRAGRDRLPDALGTIDLGPRTTDPLVAIGRAALRRDLARLTGDAARAAAWQAIVERHRQAFSGYTALAALMVRELLRAADRDVH